MKNLILILSIAFLFGCSKSNDATPSTPNVSMWGSFYYTLPSGNKLFISTAYFVNNDSTFRYPVYKDTTNVWGAYAIHLINGNTYLIDSRNGSVKPDTIIFTMSGNTLKYFVKYASYVKTSSDIEYESYSYTKIN